MAETPSSTATELTELLFELAGVPLCLVAPDLTVARANAQWRRFTGCSAEQLVGADLLELLPDTRRLALYARVHAGEHVAVPLHGERLRGRQTWWDGELAPVPMEGGTGILITAREVLAEVDHQSTAAEAPPSGSDVGIGPDGTGGKSVGQVVPDTGHLYRASEESIGGISRRTHTKEHKETAQLLRELMGTTERSAAEMNAILDAIPHAVYFCGSDGIQHCNSKALRMVGANSLKDIQQKGAELIAKFRVRFTRDGALVESENLPFNRALRGELAMAEVWVCNAETDQDILLRVHFAPVLLGGRIVGAVSVHQDITEQYRMEAELREANQRKIDFLAALSHELRNPLASVRNGLYILDFVAAGSPQFDSAKLLLKRQVNHLVRLVDDLLDITRISHGKITLERGRVDAREIASRACNDLGSVFEQSKVALLTSLPTDPVWIDADATRVTQVIDNLLANAAKFTPAGGRVQLGLRSQLGRCELRVRDTGVGIEPEQLQRIFDPFAQVERTRERAQGGMGLGLALVKNLVELHGGSVHAVSEGAGHGAEFIISLPLAPPPEAHAVSEHPASAPALTLLIIEDNLDAGQSLADLLALQGHRTQLVTSGRLGVAVAQQMKPDVLICDVGLPDISGYTVIRELRSDRETAGIFAIALTGYAQPQDRQRAVEAGFDWHLAKPPVQEDLTELLAKAAAKKGKTDH